MGKKLTSAITFTLLAAVALGGVAYLSSGFSDWTPTGWQDRLTPDVSEEPPVSSEEPTPIAEYHVKFSNEVAVANFYNGGALDFDDTIPSDIDTYIIGASLDNTVRVEYNEDYYCFKMITKPTSLSLGSSDLATASVEYTNFDLGFGLYDFSSYTTITQGQIITPVFTAF